MKVVFGGTFDPVHVGHLRMATELVSELGVNSVDLMPCYQAVHKDSVSASAESRLEMLKLATAHDSCLNVDEREIRRGCPSYTIESVREMRQELGDQALSIVMGTDAARGLRTWRQAEQLSKQTHIVVVKRPGELEGDIKQCLEQLGFEWVMSANYLHEQPGGLALMLDLTQLDISSTAIREAVRKNKSIRYLVIGAVEDYICDNALYRE